MASIHAKNWKSKNVYALVLTANNPFKSGAKHPNGFPIIKKNAKKINSETTVSK